MALALDQVITASIGGGNITIPNVHVSNNTNRLLLVSLTSHQGGGAATVKYNGTSMTKLVSQVGSFSETAEIWGLVNPEVGTTFSVVTTGISGGSFSSGSAISLYNCYQALPTNTVKTSGNSNAPTVTITTQYNNSWVVDVVESEAVLTVNAAQTQDWNISQSSFENSAGSHIIVATAGAQAMIWGNASGQRWNQCALEVLDVGDTTTSTSSTSSSSSTSSTSTSSTSSSSSSSSTSSTSSSTSTTSTSISTTSISTSSTSTSSTSSSSSSSSSSTSTTLGFLNARYLGVSIMSLTKDLLDNPASTTQTNELIDSIKRDFSSINLIDVTVPMNTNAEAVAARGTPFAIQPATYANQFNSRIHAKGIKVLWRGTTCEFEGLYGFSQGNKNNGNRFSFYGEDITDNFSSSATRNHGYSLTSPAGSLTAQYLTSHQSGNDWSIVSNQLNGPAANGWVRTCLFNAAYLDSVTMVARVKKIGHQQIICRALTDQNFPGYGLQMRDTTLRIERPGIANLAEVAFTWGEGSYYWLKLQCIGNTIRGKAWADGDAEPGSWTVTATDSTYSRGYCGFSGESSFGVFDSMTITQAIDTNTWTYQAANWIRTNISIFANGDVLVPFPEASSHQALTTNGDYNQFFIDLKYILERIGSDNGKSLVSGYFSHLFTSALQNTYAAQFNPVGVATYDHYSVALGPGKRFGSFNGPANSGSETAAIATNLSEAATAKFVFIPEKVAYNQTIDVFIVNKGTGNWTMTIHDQNNNLVQMPDHTNFPVKTTTGVVTIANSLLTNGAYNTFPINWDNPRPDVSYHFHLTSTVADGTVKVTTGNPNDLRFTVCNGYKGNASADAFEIDIRKMYEITGVRQFVEEFGDYWSLDSNLSSPVRNQADHTTYLNTITAALQRLINDGILFGFIYWRILGGFESIMVDQLGGSPYDYQLNYAGVVWENFFNTNTPGTATSTSTTSTSSSSSTSTSSSSTSHTTSSSSSSSSSTSSTSSSTSTTQTGTTTSQSTTTLAFIRPHIEYD